MDSAFFQFTFGLPLYILAFVVALAIILPMINLLQSLFCRKPAEPTLEIDIELEGGEEDGDTPQMNLPRRIE